jgi:small membrane protein
MKIVLIQVLLIAVVVAVAARLFRSRGARSQALRRLGLLVLAGFAVVSILFPDLWNRIAALAGVGRGTDMVLYALVVAFLSYTVTSYLRFREIETRYTRLARRLALDEAERTYPPQARSAGGDSATDPDGPPPR